jgi:hypothetical protein
MKLREGACSENLLFRELDHPVQVVQIPGAQEVVHHHGAQRGREIDCEPEMDSFVLELLSENQDGNIGLGQSLKKPVLFQEILVLRMPYIRKVGMEHQTPEALGVAHGSSMVLKNALIFIWERTRIRLF